MEERLTFETATKLACELLGVTLPTTKEALKSAFRERVKMLRPDLAQNKQNDLLFIETKKAYDRLMGAKMLLGIFTDGEEEPKTTYGTPLSALGLGLGPNKNGRDCGECQRKGYIERKIFGEVRCGWCTWGWAYAQPCLRCSGTGKYKLRSGVVKGDCYGCKGTGIRHFPTIVRCRVCSGTGWKKEDKPKVIYDLCIQCMGKGEIEIFNPVIPKGRLI